MEGFEGNNCYVLSVFSSRLWKTCYSYLLQYPTTNAEGTIVELRSFKLVRIGRFLEIPSVLGFRRREELNTRLELQHHFRYARAWEG